MRKLSIITIVCLLISTISYGQAYQFRSIVENKISPIKSQDRTGTCWCFATTSFLESELLRMGKGEHDLSEMFTVRNNYIERINDNYLREGNGNIDEGSISHMAINAIAKYGILPESEYKGINYNMPTHNHTELSKFIKAIAKVTIGLKKRSPEYYKLQESLFDIYLGEVPETFTYEGKEYTPITFRDELGIKCEDYVELTSFTHHPFYQQVTLEIPDNWDHQRLYNLPLDEFMAVIDYALNKGYTVVWDGDVSEPGYAFLDQIAILPADKKLKKTDIQGANKVFKEEQATQESRQAAYESFITTDDHLEHIFGIAQDQNGVKYYNVKNSWGTNRNGTGCHYMSENFIKAKTISILLHKNALPKDIKKKLNIK